METITEDEERFVFTTKSVRSWTDDDGTVHTITEETRREVPKLPALPRPYKAVQCGDRWVMTVNDEHPCWSGHPAWKGYIR